MATIFNNSFFSLAGQKERLTNVVNVLKQSLNPFSSKKPVANVSNPVLKSSLEFVASSPYTTAALVAAPLSGSVRSTVASTISKIPTSAKILSGGAALLAAPTVITQPKIQSKIVKTASSLTPESLLKTGTQISKVVENPTKSNIKDLVSQNKDLLTVAAIGTTALVGSKVVPIVSTAISTMATKENTKAILEASKPIESKPIYSADVIPLGKTTSSAPVASTSPQTPQTAVLKKTTAKKRRKTKKLTSNIINNQKVNVFVSNKSSSIGSKRNTTYLNRNLVYN